jgi:hypothetical protein
VSRIHNNKDTLILSLTSYPPRFSSLLGLLRSLENQTKYPDILTLNISEEDFKYLPSGVKNLKLTFPLEINLCEDLGPAKKLIPTLLKYSNSTIVTIDDDQIYPEYFLEELISESKKYPHDIIAGRAARPKFLAGEPLPISKWDSSFPNWDSTKSEQLILPIGYGGILYPPNSLHSDVTNSLDYQRLSFSTDDLWFWIQSVRKGTRIRKSEKFFSLQELIETQKFALSSDGNIEYLNDFNLKQLWQYYDMKGAMLNYLQKQKISISEVDETELSAITPLDYAKKLEKSEIFEILSKLPPEYRIRLTKVIVRLENANSLLIFEKRNLKKSLKFVFINVIRKLKALSIEA